MANPKQTGAPLETTKLQPPVVVHPPPRIEKTPLPKRR